MSLPEPPREREREHSGPIWRHPYFAYAWITALLFVFLVTMAWLALDNGWLPTR